MTFVNPFMNGSAGRNPLGAINVLNTWNFGGAASTAQLPTNAFMQGIGMGGMSPFGETGMPSIMMPSNNIPVQLFPGGFNMLNMNQMQGNPFGVAGGGFGQTVPQGFSQPFFGQPGLAQPGVGQFNFAQPGFGQPAFNLAGFGQAGFGQNFGAIPGFQMFA